MLILATKSNYQKPESIDETLLTTAGIKECRRNLILFVPKDEYERERKGMPGDPLKSKIGMAFLINLSISNGMGSFTELYKRHNTSIIRMNVYSFDVLFDNGFKDIQNCTMSLRSAFGSEIMNAYDGYNELSSDLGVYNRTFSDNSLDRDGRLIPHLIPPEFYNAEHMYLSRGDFWDLSQDSPSSFVYSGSQLIDTKTEIHLMDVGTWSSVNRSLHSVYDKLESEQLAETAVGDIFMTAAPTMISGTAFTYDTQMGENITGGSVPFAKYRQPGCIVNNLTEIKSILKIMCEDLEKEHGSLRVFYVPFLHGDRIRIICKDKNDSILERPFGIDRDYSTTTAAATLAADHGVDSFAD